MAATLSLLRKEVEQLRGTAVWLVLFSALTVWLTARLLTASGGLLSYLSIASFYASTFLIVAAVAVGQRLIVTESYDRTRRFVEALPVRRGHESAVKFAVGLGVLLALAFGVWFFALSRALGHEPVGPRFMLAMGLRLTFFVLALWALTYTFSHLGRLRIAIALICGVFVFMLDSRTEFELGRFGPMALVDDALFTSDRHTIPVWRLVESAAVAAAALALSRFLILARNGSLVERLSVPMTAGERSFAVVVGLIGLMLLSSFEPEAEAAPPIRDEHAVVDGRLSVEFADAAYRRDAERLAAYLGERLAELETIVALPPEFEVRVVLEPDLRGYEYEPRFADATDGVVLGANFAPEERWSDTEFGALVFHQVLHAKSNGRYLVEPHHAMLDGFSLWVAAHGVAGDGVDPHLLQALYADDERARLASELIRAWESSSDALGDSFSLSLAYSGWWTLHRERGPAAVAALAESEYNRPAYGDVRDWWADLGRARERRFARATGMSWREFLAAWRGELDRLRALPGYAAALAEIPRGVPRIAAGRNAREGTFVDFEIALDAPLASDSRCYAIHAATYGYDAPSGALQLVRLPFEPGETADVAYRLRGVYASGTRLFAALECTLPQFPRPVRLAAERLTIP